MAHDPKKQSTGKETDRHKRGLARNQADQRRNPNRNTRTGRRIIQEQQQQRNDEGKGGRSH